ncbi:MAG: FAD-dependent oxidoreductase [Burkholderiaceae bacterium]|nr:FAD-dependent oxidoreductase [Burkholderiaceae bacterium]
MNYSTIHCDYLIIGGGIAGASAGYYLARHGKTVILEQEEFPGFHTTGRSAAMIIPSYGPMQVRALTAASIGQFSWLTAEFNSHELLTRRGALMVAEPGQEEMLEGHAMQVESTGAAMHRLSTRAALQMVPVLKAEMVACGVFEPNCFDVDVDALLQGFLRGIRREGGAVVQNAKVIKLERKEAMWRVQLGNGHTYVTPVLLNAAGAWADAVGALAGASHIGLEPRRRSAFTFKVPMGQATGVWPLVGGVDGSWYFKPEAGLLLGSSANADLAHPGNVQPEEIDVATGIFRIEEMTTLSIRRPERTWAGLRSFVPDGGLVAGFDEYAPGFFWVAGQGGYGIQTAPAMGEACAALARSKPLPQRHLDCGLTEAMLSPARLKRESATSPGCPA